MLHSISNARFILHKLQKNHVISSRFLTGLNVWNESEGELSDELKHRIEKHWSSYVRNAHHNPPYHKDNKFYVLSMFPYPSGHLHMGHVRVYTISDAIARFQRLNGKHVIHPIGWDAFGLPAENAAIQRNIAPDEWTNYNINQMKEQLERLGCSFQWERELSTCSREYYKWTQELFLKLYNAGLVYQKESIVNWDPIDKTVLADEQVDENGNSWRSGAQVERKPLKQWFIRTTRYAKDLLAGLNDSILEDWRDIIKLQRHWIGECNGVVFDFKLPGNGESIRLWTKTPEYVEHARFILLKSNHILLSGQPKGELINQCVKLEEYAINPLNGDEIPIFVSYFDEVEFEPFTDCYLGIPSICDSDTNFALKYNIPFKKVNKLTNNEDITAKQTEICKKADELKIGGYWSSGKLRDWLISRQRYWGTPIPIIHCDKCGVVPIPSRDLPVILPPPGDSCHHPVTVNCPNCHSPTARRETDTLDTFVDSSWYYLRYLNTGYDGDMYDVTAAKEQTPVDLYIGGKEHAVLHLYYARFISHFLHSQGLLPEKEPFKRLLVQGMIMGRSYRIKGTGKYLPEEQVKIIDLKRNKAESIETGEPVVIQWEKMSKSKLNGVSPVDMFDKYSVDTTRLLILADVAPTSHRNWNTNTFPGILNWQRRLWLTIETFIKHRNNLNAIKPLADNEEFKTHEDYLFDSRNYYIKGTTFNYCTSQQISVAISKMQGLTNSIRKSPAYIYGNSPQFERALGTLLILLAPIAPHFTSELWNGFTSAPNRLIRENSAEINWDKSIFEQKWPQIDYNYNLDLVFQINGYENSTVKLPRSQIEKLSKEDALKIALNQEQIKETLTNREITESLYNMYEGYEGVLNIITKTCDNTKETNS